MEAFESERFIAMLTKTMAAYGKPLPEAEFLDAWTDTLAHYPLQVIRQAFAAYCTEEDRYAPIPAAIAKRCKLMDGRPGAEEAWAIALASRDEADTVVWTAEIAEAFGVCATILNSGDEVGARMAFKEAYTRLVTAARGARKPAHWSVSLGWDMRKREAAVTKAANAGLLPAPQVRALLPHRAEPTDATQPAPKGLAMVKEAIAKVQSGWEAGVARREAALQAEREAVAARKGALAAQVVQMSQKGRAA